MRGRQAYDLYLSIACLNSSLAEKFLQNPATPSLLYTPFVTPFTPMDVGDASAKNPPEFAVPKERYNRRHGCGGDSPSAGDVAAPPR